MKKVFFLLMTLVMLPIASSVKAIFSIVSYALES